MMSNRMFFNTSKLSLDSKITELLIPYAKKEYEEILDVFG